MFDIDGTLFRWQLYHELVFEIKSRGHFSEQEAEALDQAFVAWQGKFTSWHDYEFLVMETITRHLTEIAPKALEEAASHVVERSGHKIYGYTAKLLKKLQTEGYYCLALSASQQEIAEKFADKYSFDDCVAAVYEREGDNYTGNHSRVVHGHKRELLETYLADHKEIGLTLDDSVAVGDSASDISMLEMVDRPIAFNPSSELLEAAMKHGWKVVVERKNIAYELEGADGHFVLARTDQF